MAVGTLLLGVVGMASIGMSMERHHEQIWGKAKPGKPRVWGLRTLGYLDLILAAVWAVSQQGASMGLTFWVMAIGLAAVCVGLLFSYVPRVLPWLTVLALVGAVTALPLTPW